MLIEPIEPNLDRSHPASRLRMLKGGWSWSWSFDQEDVMSLSEGARDKGIYFEYQVVDDNFSLYVNMYH